MKEININLNSNNNSYKVIIGNNIFKDYIKEYNNDFFIIDSHVYNLYKDSLSNKKVYIYNSTENNKNIHEVEKILSWLSNENCLRDSKVISIGGGITGDISGFASGVYMRGIDIVQIPTTYLSMVDSSVGGKTGINFQGIKNNIGLFHQPKKVIIDTNFLNTLPKNEFLNGFVETIKIATIQSKKLLEVIEQEQEKILNRENEIIINILYESIKLKAKIVEADEREKGLRKLLNFGHTIGHAIEKDSNYKIKHGYSVALGMIYESQFGVLIDKINDTVYNRLYKLLKSFKYKVKYKIKDRKKFLESLSKDKKVTRNGITLALTGNDWQGNLINVYPKDILNKVFK